MRPGVSTLILFVLSGIAAAVCAGMVGALLTTVAAVGPAGLLLGLFFAAAGAILAIQWAAIPAMLVGGILWSLGASQPRLRRRWAWAATGGLAGLAFLPFPWPRMVDDALHGGELHAPSIWAPLISRWRAPWGRSRFAGRCGS
jgi:hypothetical protein